MEVLRSHVKVTPLIYYMPALHGGLLLLATYHISSFIFICECFLKYVFPRLHEDKDCPYFAPYYKPDT